LSTSQYRGDEATLSIIEALATDLDSSNILIIVAFRDEDKGDALSIFHSNCDSKRCLRVTDIALTNLSDEGLYELIADLISDHDQMVVGLLSHVVSKKTLNNPFHVFQFLDSLEANELLVFSEASGESVFDISKIRTDTSVADNVYALIDSKLERLQPDLQSLLVIASCLGHSFSASMLETILFAEPFDVPNLMHIQQLSDRGTFITEMNRGLAIGVNEGLLEPSVDSTKFYFTHDRLQECLYNRLGAHEKKILHLKIGRVVQDVKGRSTTETFFAADHLNRGSSEITCPLERQQLAELNLRAAKFAIAKAAFSSASQYLKEGSSMLDKEHLWITNYYVTLDLCSTIAEVEYSQGNYDKCHQVIDEVLAHSVSLGDTFRVTFVNIDSLGSQNKFADAMNIAMSALSDLGVRFPCRFRKLRIAKELKLTKKKLEALTDEDILGLDHTTNANDKAAMRMLSSVATYAYFKCNDKESFTFACLQMVQLSLRGLSPMSPHGFACFAFLHALPELHDEAYRLAKLSLKILQEMRSKEAEARTLVTIFAWVWHHRRPLDECIQAFRTAEEVGTKMGDVGTAAFSAQCFMTSAYGSGLSLIEIEDDVKHYCDQMVGNDQVSYSGMSLPCYQCILCLTGRSDNPARLEGAAMDKSVIIQATDKNTKLAEKIVGFFRLQLACFFEDWDLALDALSLVEGGNKTFTAHFNSNICIFFTAFAYTRLAAETGKKSFSKKADKLLTSIQKAVWNGSVNLEFGLLFLLAEKSLHSKASETAVKVAYDRAIECAVHNKTLHYEAWANERAAVAMLHFGFMTLATRYADDAIDRFSEWGAHAKVEHCETKFRELLAARNNHMNETIIIRETNFEDVESSF
jgi:predicted ATPase